MSKWIYSDIETNAPVNLDLLQSFVIDYYGISFKFSNNTTVAWELTSDEATRIYNQILVKLEVVKI